MNYLELKELFLLELISLVDKKVGHANAAIESTTESKNTATKSTAGDKHETGRAMMERELALSNYQLQKALIQKNELSKISLEMDFSTVKPGSLVITSRGNYFITIGLGKINVNENECYAISGGSPIGLVLMGSKKGQYINFKRRKIEIIAII